MRWRVQLGIYSTSDVSKFCQNWTSRGASPLANFQTRVLLIPSCTSNMRRAWRHKSCTNFDEMNEVVKPQKTTSNNLGKRT